MYSRANTKDNAMLIITGMFPDPYNLYYSDRGSSFVKIAGDVRGYKLSESGDTVVFCDGKSRNSRGYSGNVGRISEFSGGIVVQSRNSLYVSSDGKIFKKAR